jgi:hypothetical protein
LHEMFNPQHSAGLLLPGLQGGSDVESQGGIIAAERQAGRQTERERKEERRSCKVIYKRGKKGIYWYRFMWKGELIRESTHQTNDKVARNQESAHRTRLSNGEVGIREKKPVPTLSEFCKDRFEPWAKSSFEKSTPANWLWYRAGIRALLAYKPLANAKLDSIGNELAADFAAQRQVQEKQISTINSSLRVLRRILRLSVEWRVLDAAPVLSLLPGERHRETVVTPEHEQLYLHHCPELLKQIATVLADSGMRPEECYKDAMGEYQLAAWPPQRGSAGHSR